MSSAQDTGPFARPQLACRWRRLLFPCALTTLFLAPASTIAHEPHKYRFERLSIEQGLSQSTVHTILQDRHGFLWLGTQDGLNRYDGYSFRVFRQRPEDPTSLSSNFIRVLYEDRSGRLWVGTDGGGLNVRDPVSGAFRHLRHDPQDPGSLSHDFVTSILIDGADRMWIGTGGGLDRIDPDTGAVTRHQFLDGGAYILTLAEDRDGRLWVGTDDDGIFVLDRTGRPAAHYRYDPSNDASLSNDTVNEIRVHSTGTVWAATNRGLNRFVAETGAFERFTADPDRRLTLSDDNVRTLFEDHDGLLWVGTQDGLNHFDPSERESHSYLHDPGEVSTLGNSLVLSLFRDHSGVLWVGTDGGGLGKLDPDKQIFEHLRAGPPESGGLSHGMAFALLEDRQGVLWVGTWGGGLNRVDRDRDTVTRVGLTSLATPTGFPGSVSALTEDRAGRLWVGTEAGLAMFDETRRTQRGFRAGSGPLGLAGASVRALLEDRDGALWIGTQTGGLDRLSPDRRRIDNFPRDPERGNSLSHPNVTALHESPGGALWVGTLDGLNRFDRDSGTFEHLGVEDGLSSSFIRSLYQEPSGDLWVATDHGLNLLRGVDTDGPLAPAEVESYTTAEGLPNDVIYGILPDNSGRLWLSTNKGLARFDQQSGAFLNIDSRDGLQGDEFNTNSYLRTSSGELLFGGTNGLNIFRPEEMAENPHIPRVVITSFRKFNRDVPLARSLTEVDSLLLTHRDNVVSFGFAALDFRAPLKNRYAYRMHGVTDGWIDLGSQREITFANIAPGDYTLQVRGSNNSGTWNQEGRSLAITVTPPWWSTLWFRGLLVGVAALSIVIVFRGRTRRIRERNVSLGEVVERLHREMSERQRIEAEREKMIAKLEAQNEELEQFSYTVSHDLKSPLVTIRGYVGAMARDAERGRTGRLSADLQRIGKATDQMKQLLDELLELSRVGRVANPREEVALFDIAHEAATVVSAESANGVAIEIADDLPVVWGDRVRLREVFQNLIGNSVKFLGAQSEPRVEVGVRREADRKVLFVRDNGIGINPRYHERVFGLFERLDAQGDGTGVGLALVKRIVEVHGGDVWIESDGEGQGTGVCFTLKDCGAEEGLAVPGAE